MTSVEGSDIQVPADTRLTMVATLQQTVEVGDHIQEKHPHLTPLAIENDCPFVDNELLYGRAEPGHPVIVDYFYHEEVRGSENTGKRKRT